MQLNNINQPTASANYFPVITMHPSDLKLEKPDLTYLRDLADNDPEFIREMIDAFVSDMPLMMASLESAWLSGNGKSVRMMAHKMKSSAQIVGLNRFALLARTLEENCIGESLPAKEVQVSIPEMRAILEQAYSELERVSDTL
ncbi:MAG: Hpt domain-containing protein [Bacteroidota bacterium]